MNFEYQEHPKDVRKFDDIYIGDLFRLIKDDNIVCIKISNNTGISIYTDCIFEFTNEEVELLDYKIIIYSEE